MNKGLKYCGQIVIKDIGIPEEIYQDADLNLNCQIIDDSFLKLCKEPRSKASHKGTYGHLLAVGGSMGMSGAITLTARSALRAGVGILTCAVPQAVQMHVAVNVPEAMVQPAARRQSIPCGQFGSAAGTAAGEKGSGSRSGYGR